MCARTKAPVSQREIKAGNYNIQGPLAILLLLLTLGPCIINRLVQILRDHVGAIQLIVLHAQYKPLVILLPLEHVSSIN